MFKWIKTMLTRNPCKECDYYCETNKTCQSKKCCTGGYGYVTFWDRLWCEPYKGEAKMDEVNEYKMTIEEKRKKVTLHCCSEDELDEALRLISEAEQNA